MRTKTAARPHPIRLEPLERRTLLNATIDIDAAGLWNDWTDPAAASTLRVSEVDGVRGNLADAERSFTAGGRTIKLGADSSTSFNGDSLVIVGDVDSAYGQPYGPKDTAHVPRLLAEGVVNAAGARIVAYATDQNGARFEMESASGADGRWVLSGAYKISEGVYGSGLPTGVYRIEVQAFDDARGLVSPTVVLATRFAVGPQPPPISIDSQPLNATAGENLDDVIVATFNFIDSQWTPFFTPLILWGDGGWSTGRAVRNDKILGRFEILGSHAYAQSGAFTPAVILHYTSGPINYPNYVNATYYSENALAVAGGVVPDAGPNVQALAGRVSAAEGTARIVAYAVPEDGGGAPILMGQAVSGASGYWTLSSDVPSPRGRYAVQVQAFNDAQHMGSALTTIATGYVVASDAAGALVVTGSVIPSFGPFPPPRGSIHSELFHGSVSARVQRIEIYGTPQGGGAPVLFGAGRIFAGGPATGSYLWSYSPPDQVSIPKGVYTIQVQAFDDANHLTSPLTTIARNFIVGSPTPPASAPSVVPSKPLVATAGEVFTDMVVATFNASPGSSAADFSPLILWGDGGWSDGRIVGDPSDPTRFDVVGSHFYAHAGTFTPAVVVQPTSGDWTANGYSANVMAIAGGFVDPRAQIFGATNQRVQTLFGRVTAAEGAARIVAYATPNDGGWPILMGQTVSGPGGYWTLPSDVSLPDGRYTVQVQAFNDLSAMGTALTTLRTDLVVDTEGPRITGVQLLPSQGKIVVSYLDAGSGVDYVSASGYNEYAFSGGAILSIGGSAPPESGPQRLNVVLDTGRPIRRGSYLFTIRSMNIRDWAGNSLQGNFDGPFPTRGAGDFNARFVVQGRTARPLPVPPRPPVRPQPRPAGAWGATMRG